jgi:predicted RNA-binding protein with TRAM domain
VEQVLEAEESDEGEVEVEPVGDGGHGRAECRG